MSGSCANNISGETVAKLTQAGQRSRAQIEMGVRDEAGEGARGVLSKC